MIILALDTTTRVGSVALMQDGLLKSWRSGRPDQTHGERLPGDLLALLDEQGSRLDEVDLFGVCIGPGSFTGLRVGLATIQGLALAHRRRVVAVPTLEALAYAGLWGWSKTRQQPSLIVPWMDAQRGQVSSAIYAVSEASKLEIRQPPSVGSARSILKNWEEKLLEYRALFVGDAVEADKKRISETVNDDPLFVSEMPPLAPAVARLAHTGGLDLAISPHAIRPIYSRRSDAELAREERQRK